MDRPEDGVAASRGRRWGVLAGSSVVLSAVLKGASQRWALDVHDPGSQRTIEDHLFDYVLPAEPWVNIGSAALFFGAGYLLIAVGIVCLGLACRAVRGGGWAVGPVILTATSVFGFVLAGIHIAPLLVGYQSYDTTPWTEGVVAAFTLLAAVPILIGSLRRG